MSAATMRLPIGRDISRSALREKQQCRMAALGHKRKSSVGFGMSEVGGRADFNFGRLYVCL